jgi:hypothetical protein
MVDATNNVDVTNNLARALIAAHGLDALPIAERAADNVRNVYMTDKTKKWAAVIAAIKEIQTANR